MWQVDLESEEGEEKRPLSDRTESIQISPNPSSNYISVDLNSVRTESIPKVINIMSSKGRKMFTQQIEFENGSEIKVLIADWPNGQYAVQVIDENGNFVASSFYKM